MHETDKYNVDTLPFTSDETQTVDPPSSFNKLSKPKRDSVVYTYIYSLYTHTLTLIGRFKSSSWYFVLLAR